MPGDRHADEKDTSKGLTNRLQRAFGMNAASSPWTAKGWVLTLAPELSEMVATVLLATTRDAKHEFEAVKGLSEADLETLLTGAGLSGLMPLITNRFSEMAREKTGEVTLEQVLNKRHGQLREMCNGMVLEVQVSLVHTGMGVQFAAKLKKEMDSKLLRKPPDYFSEDAHFSDCVQAALRLKEHAKGLGALEFCRTLLDADRPEPTALVKTTDAVKSFMDHANAEVRKEAIGILSKLEKNELAKHAPAIAAMLHDKNWHVRCEALTTIATLEPDELAKYIPAIQEVAKADKDAYLQAEAGQIMTKLRSSSKKTSKGGLSLGILGMCLTERSAAYKVMHLGKGPPVPKSQDVKTPLPATPNIFNMSPRATENAERARAAAKLAVEESPVPVLSPHARTGSAERAQAEAAPAVPLAREAALERARQRRSSRDESAAS